MSDKSLEGVFSDLNDAAHAGDEQDNTGLPGVTGAATPGGLGGGGINAETLAGEDLAGEVSGTPLNADYMADRRTNVRNNEADDTETDTSTGFAGEGGANPDADLPPTDR